MPDIEGHITTLAGLIDMFWSHLSMHGSSGISSGQPPLQLEDLGDVDDRSANIADILDNSNDYLVSHPTTETDRLRLFIVQYIPRLLVGYQALRFPQILEDSSRDLPLKEHLSRFPEKIYQTGLFLPVSACLRLIAVSLTDDSAKQLLIESDGLKAIIGHTVDDPLNPLQRESAVFVMKVLTLNYSPAQAAVAKFMSSQ